MTKSRIKQVSSFEGGDRDVIFEIRGGHVPWGDYGSILVHGMTAHLGRKGEQLQLERTGPFVPPISFPGINDIVVTSEMKAHLENAGFRGITFRPVLKAHISNVDWHEWDLSDDEPEEYPQEGEPEGYILDYDHCEDTSAELGDLWEVVTSTGAEMERVQVGESPWEVEFRYVPGSWNGSDLFAVETNAIKYTSHRAKRWLETYYPEWTSFAIVAQKDR